MKSIARITLLLFWLFAITAPSIVTLCNSDNPIVVTNLNEEEHQESGKKLLGEEKFGKENSMDFSLIAIYENLINANLQILRYSGLSLDVLSPPPKSIC